MLIVHQCRGDWRMSSTVTVRNDSETETCAEWLTSWPIFQPDIASFLLTWIEWNRNFESCNINGDWWQCRSSGDMPCECVIAMDDDAGRCPEDRKNAFQNVGPKICAIMFSQTVWLLLHRESKKGCHPIHGYNFVSSWSICKILSLLQRAVNFQQNSY